MRKHINGVGMPDRIWLVDEGSGDVCWTGETPEDAAVEAVGYVRVTKRDELAAVEQDIKSGRYSSALDRVSGIRAAIAILTKGSDNA